MNPMEPHDPLWKLLGKGRKVEVRPNFTQNVVRLARNTEQERGWWAGFKAWWQDAVALYPAGRLAAVAAAVALMAGLAWMAATQPGPADPVVAEAPAVAEKEVVPAVEVPLVPEVETQLESLDYLDELLALEDTSGLSDREIAFLLY